jgi:hypothetical protein
VPSHRLKGSVALADVTRHSISYGATKSTTVTSSRKRQPGNQPNPQPEVPHAGRRILSEIGNEPIAVQAVKGAM